MAKRRTLLKNGRKKNRQTKKKDVKKELKNLGGNPFLRLYRNAHIKAFSRESKGAKEKRLSKLEEDLKGHYDSNRTKDETYEDFTKKRKDLIEKLSKLASNCLSNSRVKEENLKTISSLLIESENSRLLYEKEKEYYLQDCQI